MPLPRRIRCTMKSVAEPVSREAVHRCKQKHRNQLRLYCIYKILHIAPVSNPTATTFLSTNNLAADSPIPGKDNVCSIPVDKLLLKPK